MKISDKQTHLGSDEHKNHHNEIWREDATKYITYKTRHFQSEKHIPLFLKKQKQTNSMNKITSG